MPEIILDTDQREKLLKALEERFRNNMDRHAGLAWGEIGSKLENNAGLVRSLYGMERTGGEPDIVLMDAKTGEYAFVDCSPESPLGRRNTSYDRQGQEARKSGVSEGNAVDMASDMGIELLTEDQYLRLQETGEFDRKTSSWLLTPGEVRKQGGAIFGDRRYGRVFVYHNGASSYYSARGFRGILRI